MQLPIEKIVDLHEIDQPVLQQPKRTIDLVKTGLLSTGPHLGRQKRAGAILCLCEQIANDAFGRAVHRRGVDDGTAGGEKYLEDREQWSALLRSCADIEGAISAASNDG